MDEEDKYIDEEEKINEFYKLKQNYENKIKDEIKKINTIYSSLKEKREEYKKLKPKCITCNRPVGTIFSIKFDKNENSRLLRVKCGNKLDPCNLNIVIKTGTFFNLQSNLLETEQDIINLKKTIIIDKNNLLFGYMTSEEVLQKFEEIKKNISNDSESLDIYLETYNSIVDIDMQQLYEKKIESYYIIQKIKKTIIDYNNKTENINIKDIINIYLNELQPILNIIKELKYKKNIIEFNEFTNTFHLIQKKYNLEDFEFTLDNPEIKMFNIYNQQKSKSKLNIESSSEEKEENLPIISEEGNVTWENPNYTKVWNTLSKEYKESLLLDNEWLQNTMDTYVDLNKNKKLKQFVEPKNIIFPPNLENGKYNLGNKTYTILFNNLEETYKKSLLTINKETFKDILNGIFKKNVNFKN